MVGMLATCNRLSLIGYARVAIVHQPSVLSVLSDKSWVCDEKAVNVALHKKNKKLNTLTIYRKTKWLFIEAAFGPIWL